MSTMQNAERESEARTAAEHIRRCFNLASGHQIGIGLVLGTGWGDALRFENARELAFKDIPGFETLQKLEGHARRLAYGTVGSREVLALRGRVHLNEAPPSEAVSKMVRLQTEMLLALGVETLIVTSAVGSLRDDIRVGDIAVANGFITVFAPDMPLWGGEFCSPEDTLDAELQAIAHDGTGIIKTHVAAHVMVRGPFFEGRRYDKLLLARVGASVVGMSMLPEACIAALYGAKVIGLGFVTNTASEEHSHEENLARAKESSQKLGRFLKYIIEHLPE